MPDPDAPSLDPALARLAAACGVATSYEDWQHEPVTVAPAAVTAALAALGVDAADPDAALAALTAAREAEVVPPATVVRAGEPATLTVRGLEPVVVLLEDGGEVPLSDGGPGDGAAREVELPDLPLGWHAVRSGDASGVLVVAPPQVPVPTTRSWGWMLQLYALRSAGSWGVGDCADLRAWAERAREDGARTLLLNPLHAETPVTPLDPSPYSPSSRRFRSPLYLRVEETPEYRAADDDLRARVDALRPPTDPERVLRDPAWEAKRAALELLWPGHRADALAAFRAERGQALEDVALFFALAEEHGVPWQEWPEDLRRPDGAGVAAARARHAERTSFWAWVQLLVDEQLAAVTAAFGDGRVVHDLAVGVGSGGADAWALQDALALGTTVGAPPDSFNQQGQDWGLPPWRPDRLRALGYAPYRSLVQGVLRSAGGLRIDHVMGLFRLWWVPAGSSAAEGTYVSYDSDALLGVLALEAHRAGAVVVGEDLGTVEDRVRASLERWGVLGSAVLWFERDEGSGEFLAPSTWRSQVLATVTTHDLPTAAGFLAEEHVRVRDELDQLGVPVEQERERAVQERALLLDRLRSEGLLEDGGSGAEVPDAPAAVRAMHAALAASPALVALAAPGDAVGDLRQPNLPGTVDQYPNWRLPVADGEGRPLGLEELLAHPGVREVAQLLDRGVRGTTSPGAVPSSATTDRTREP